MLNKIFHRLLTLVTGVYFQPAPAEDSHRKLSVIPSPAADINAKLVFEIVLKEMM